jgi:ABC-2 type transport system ATP-binding protein
MGTVEFYQTGLDLDAASTLHAGAMSIHVRGLEKAYKELKVLRGVDFEVAPGSVFALLGSNGAGKTTVVRILSTLLRADAGTARVNGFDVATQAAGVRESISLTGQFAAVDEILSGRENLVMVARLRHLKDPGPIADGLLSRFSLTEAGGRRVATYSGGMRRRLDLAASLVGDPEVIFLDEPTTGLDPRSRAALWDVVRELSAQGTTVFLTTQYLEEADRLADRIAVLDKGSLVAEGTSAELKQRVAGHRLDLVLADSASYLHLAPRATYTDPDTRTLGIPTDGSAAHIRALLDLLDPTRTAISSFSVHTATLDDVFLELTRSPAAEPARV